MVHVASPPGPNTRQPSLVCPPGTVDTHFHLFGPLRQFPLIPESPYSTGDALPQSCIAMHEALGVDYGVFVSGGGYGRNTEYLVSVLESTHGRFRGVAVPPTDPTASELDRMDAAGVRGIRFASDSTGSHVAGIEPDLARRVYDRGWHVEFIARPGEFEQYVDRLVALPNDLVIDHFGCVAAERGVNQPAVRALLKLLDTGRVWVKMSGPMYGSRLDFPYADMQPIADALVRHAPDRLLWGTDWPHLHTPAKAMPNDADLLDLMLDWVPDEASRNRILSDNPRQLYGFPPS
jgi:2-pyrone-4,6-dicarboxylate lactonase